MKKDLLKIINHYGVMPQLKYFQSEVWELNEAILEHWYEEYKYYPEVEKGLVEHIAEEIGDNCVMLYQFPLYYYEWLDEHNIAPYEFKTDNYENIEDINEYLKDFQKNSIFKLNRAVITAEEREQDYISEYRYEDVIEAVDEVMYKLISIKEYYHITDRQIKEVMEYKVKRQLERIENESN